MRSFLPLVLFLAFQTACSCTPKKPAVETLKKEGEPCSSDDRCETGLCDGVSPVCVRKCAVGCNAEEVCTQLTPGRFSCQPDRRGLCQTCLVDSDCPYPADKCIVVNNEKVCGRDCAFDQNCPSGYVCVNARGSDGVSKVQQCSPMVASCACLARGDLMQPCVVANDAGTCFGVKTCDLVTNGVSCSASPPEFETCNGKDDDCDGQVDEGGQTITCGVGACQRTASACVDGGVGMCTPGQPITELCNNIDDDCDGNVDNGFPVDSDVNNCGGCGVRCMLPHATPVCTARTCRVGTCDMGWENCDTMDPNGCEVETATNPMHCGRCGNTCTRPNSTATCMNGTCQFQCAAGFYDLNGDPMDGCEYACTFMSATDLPDLAFVDANCDGIDGEVTRGIFVSATGSDSNPGTRTQPMQTLAAATTSLVTQGKRDIYVSAGTHTGPLQLLGVSGVNVAGGYHATTWQRSLQNQVIVRGGAKALEIEGASNVLVQAIRFEGGAGAPSAYGGWVKESQGVKLERLELRAGNGANGNDGMTGAVGTAGSPGGDGRRGCSTDVFGIGGGCLLFGFCSSPPATGPGGASACGMPGGNGGAPSPMVGNGAPAGSPGSNAPNGTGLGGAGVGGQIGRGPAPSTSNGTPGAPGSNGTNGPAGSTPFFSMNGYTGGSGMNGSSGTPGRGGGGGGGGCGGQLTLDAMNTCLAYGSGGGGGGGGGCGGSGGTGGDAGGASIALFLFNANVTAQSVALVSGSGGNGGRGGAGGGVGQGGSGGASPYGGNTPRPFGNDSGQGNACVGGIGGAGGNGGAGGHGGGGSGGSTYGLVKNAASVWTVTGSSTMLGTPGAGGPSQGTAGPAGVSTTQLTF